MTRVHSQEKEQFEKLFRENRLDKFEDRYKILEVFLQTEQHVTTRELAELLDERNHHLEPEFIRDTLHIMCRFGFAHKNRFDDGKLRYEHRHLGDHHDHMVCTKCKNVFEFRDEGIEKRQLAIASSHGFHMLQHKMDIYGICRQCAEDPKQLLPLVSTKSGEQLTIKALSGSEKMQIRMQSMGLRAGDRIAVITNNDRGQLVIAVDQKRYVIGREMARTILVQRN